MKYQLIAKLYQKLKALCHLFHDASAFPIAPNLSLNAIPDFDWDLHRTHAYRNRIKTLARFFFALGCLTLVSAVSLYMWESYLA